MGVEAGQLIVETDGYFQWEEAVVVSSLQRPYNEKEDASTGSEYEKERNIWVPDASLLFVRTQEAEAEEEVT